MSEKLRSGYTTGTHATAILVASLTEYFEQNIVDTLEITLPKDIKATIEVTREDFSFFSTIKVDNDDIDVTKGAKISVEVQEEEPRGLKEQTPSLLEVGEFSLSVWAGDGVGVVTKKGLKITPNHPAINPVPLSMMQENITNIVASKKRHLHAVFSVQDGEIIARDTANSKVGVIGGISILGTRGIVKPVSASAYIDSVETEIDVSAAQTQEYIVFTLGNTALDYAKDLYDETSIVEIGNFVYDASERLKKHSFKKVIFVTSVAKMCKVAQGFKNTHNKFGTIDFEVVREWLEKDLGFTLPSEEFLTLKAVLQTIKEEETEPFVKLLGQKSALMFQKWFNELEINTQELEIATIHGKNIIIEELKW
ncbi:cobalt-precorrin-5B (C(1))-methyltransferase [Sulfurimonas sp. SAG-AH-194-C21]|nr:cobalt-precorrin-5B (C(1))-methyltransferase CbiD [Sulfurimonas sp. SAG-AH-194-C21]MDF1882579.1 cobalt-precorrin-5B (C(1))-methyltransferase [Sulfurimonas sp. SAG-AH-194-C21]